MNARSGFICVGLLFAGLTSALAQTTVWQGPAGTAADWVEPANWVGGEVPVGGIVNITNDGIAEIASGSVSNCTIYAGRWSGPGTLKISGGEVTNCSLQIGYDGGKGKLVMTGGSVSYPNWFGLRVGAMAGATGEVVMTGGTLEPTSFLIGDAGTGSFVLSNGTVRSTYWQTFVGSGAGSDGTFIQEGGTNDYTVASCYIGYGAGSAGRYILNGGMLDTHSYSVTIGSSGTGYMEINGGTLNPAAAVNVSYYTNSTGTLVLNSYTNTFADLQIGPGWPHWGGIGTCIMNGGDITITGNGYVGSASNCVATFVQNGGTLARKGLTLPNSDGATGTFIISNAAVTAVNGGITLKPGGRLEIHDSDVTCKGMFIRGSDAYAEMGGGTLTVDGKILIPDGTNAATFYMTGGLLQRNWVNNQSYMFYIGGAAADSGPGTFIQTGGVVNNTNGLYLARYSTNHVGRYEISGGTLNSPTKEINISITRVAAFRVKGSAPFVNVRSLAATTNEFWLEYVLDKSPEHLAPIHYAYDRAYRCGHLRVGLDGGVLLTQTNAFALMRWEAGFTTISYDYLSRPNSNMWAEVLTPVSPRESLVTLADGYKMSDLSFGGATSASFSESAMGHVTVANLSTNRLVGLAVRLAVNEGAMTLSDVVEGFVAAGYTNSVVEAAGGYNVKLVIPPDGVVDQSVKTPSCFVWDFTDVTTGVTNATVTAVSVERILPPPGGTMIMVL